MSFLLTHHAIAVKVLQSDAHIANPMAFVLGSLAPDAISFRTGGCRADKTATHFCVGEEGWGNYTNYETWMDNAVRKVKEYANCVDKDFLFGYLVHIMTDIEQAKRFSAPVRELENMAFTQAYYDDCVEIDTRLLVKIEDVDALFAQLLESNRYCLVDLFSIDAVEAMLVNMQQNIYANRYPNPNYVFRELTEAKAELLMNDMAAMALVLQMELL